MLSGVLGKVRLQDLKECMALAGEVLVVPGQGFSRGVFWFLLLRFSGISVLTVVQEGEKK